MNMSFKKTLTCLVMVVLVQSALAATVAEKAPNQLSKLLSNPTARTTAVYQTIVNIQATIDNILTYVNSLVTSSNISNILSVIQTEIVSPLLTLSNNLASLTFIQLIQPVYAVVLVLQTVLTIANSALTRATSVVTGTVTILQTIVDSVFSVILTLVQNLGS